MMPVAAPLDLIGACAWPLGVRAAQRREARRRDELLDRLASRAGVVIVILRRCFGSGHGRWPWHKLGSSLQPASRDDWYSSHHSRGLLGHAEDIEPMELVLGALGGESPRSGRAIRWHGKPTPEGLMLMSDRCLVLALEIIVAAGLLEDVGLG